MELTERQERILKAAVESYIATAHPVGSTVVVEASHLPVSSATVRNELARLEELGYLWQLHTSGGRVPTNAGYRYYVERLMEPSALPNREERSIRHQFHEGHLEVQEWLKLAAAIMAARLHNVGLVTAPKAAEIRLRHLELIAIQDTVALVIAVLQDGTVLQEMMALPEPRSQEELSVQAERLNQELLGRSTVEIEARIPNLAPGDEPVARMVVHLLRRGEEEEAALYHAGLSDMISQPEFLSPRAGEPISITNQRLRHMVDFLQQGFAIQQLFSGLPTALDIHVVIGDAVAKELEDYSFVLGRYRSRQAGGGYLGIVGPTRLQYTQAVALVRYMTHLMTDLMQAY